MKKLLIGLTLLTSMSSFAASSTELRIDESLLTVTPGQAIEILSDTEGKVDYIECDGEFNIYPHSFSNIHQGVVKVEDKLQRIFIVNADEYIEVYGSPLLTEGKDVCNEIKVFLKN